MQKGLTITMECLNTDQLNYPLAFLPSCCSKHPITIVVWKAGEGYLPDAQGSPTTPISLSPIHLLLLLVVVVSMVRVP